MFFCLNLFATEEFVQKQIAVGESRILNTPQTSGFQVSRRGIVDIQRIDDTKWRMIGLRRGFVSLTPFSNMQSRIVLEVYRKEFKDQRNKPVTHSRKPLSPNGHFSIEFFIEKNAYKQSNEIGSEVSLKNKRISPRSNMQKNQSKLLANPNLNIINGKEFEVCSGGKTYQQTPSNQVVPFSFSEKEYGLRIKGRVYKTNKKKFRINYDIELSTQPDKTGKAQKERLKSASLLNSREKTSLGKISLDINEKNRSGLYPLDQIPILAPLLTLGSKNTSSTSIVISATIHEK